MYKDSTGKKQTPTIPVLTAKSISVLCGIKNAVPFLELAILGNSKLFRIKRSRL